MKITRSLGVALVFALPPFVLASPGPTVQPKELGTIDAAVNYCVRVDPKSEDQYRERTKNAIAGLSDKELAKIRASGDYKATYLALTADLEKLPTEEGVESCRASLKGAKQ